MQELKPPKVIFDTKNNKIYYSTNYVRTNFTSQKIRLLEKVDITLQLNKVMNHIEERARLEEKRNRIDDPTRKIICLCGSTKFKTRFEELSQEFALKGHIILSVGAFPHVDSNQSGEEIFGEVAKAKLDELHKRKIDLADIIYFINVDGYMGKSTTSEFEYAKMQPNKIIIFDDSDAGELFTAQYEEHEDDVLDTPPS